MNLQDHPELTSLYKRMKAYAELDYGPGALPEEKFFEIYEQGQQALAKFEEENKKRDWLEAEIERLKRRVEELEIALREKH